MPKNPVQGSLFIENPHSGHLSLDSELVQPSAAETPEEGHSVRLDHRNTLLIQALNNIAIARRDEGYAVASTLPAYRGDLQSRSYNLDEKAKNAREKASKLRSEARDLFIEQTGIPVMVEKGAEDIDGVDPEVLIISYFQNFNDKIKNTSDLQRLRAKLSKKT